MLGEAGVGAIEPEFAVVWEVFRRFAAQPVDDVDVETDGDLIVFESIADEVVGYEIHLIRQFSFYDEDGEFDGLEQLTLELHQAGEDVGEPPAPAVVWGTARRRTDEGPHEGIHPDVATWADAVQAEPAFTHASQVQFERMTLDQEAV